MHDFASAFIPLFVTVDAFGMIPIFVALTHTLAPIDRRRAAFEAVGFSLLLCLCFMVLGNAVFIYLGITQSDFRIAGGLILLVFAVIELVSPAMQASQVYEKPGLFPLATPMIAGAATLTTTLVTVGRFKHGYLLTSLSLVANFSILLLLLISSEFIIRVAGANGLRACSKLIMVLLTAIAVYLIRTGVAEVLNR